MKQRLVIIIIVLSLICLLAASFASISRAKNLQKDPDQGSTDQSETTGETESELESEIESDGGMLGSVPYVEYVKQEVHEGTAIAYRGSGDLADKIVVIDAGHQLHAMTEHEPVGPGASETKIKVTGGTQGSTTGLAEYELNLRVALALRDVLVERGYCVVMVRETNEVEISNSERAQLANEVGADIFIRIHANGDEDTSMKGAMTVCQTAANPYNADIYEECRLLSETVLQAFCAGTGMEQRNVWETDTMTGTNWAQVPTTIVEMGFMTNAEDDAAMAAEGFAELAAEAIARGIADYFEHREYETEGTAPDEDTTAPDEDTTAPEEDTTAPEEDTTAPEEDTTVPEEDTSAPEEDTTAPEEDTTAPEEDTTVPEEDTSAPEEDTTEPETSTEEETTEPETSTEEETSKPSSKYDINYELEAELGESFEDVYLLMETTAYVWVRIEPSTRGDAATRVDHIETGDGWDVICIGLGQNWNRVLIDGNVYYISAAYMREVSQ